MITFSTQSDAVYELDTLRRRIRRTEPGKGKTRRIGVGWCPYELLLQSPRLGSPVSLRWPDGTYTVTTEVWMIIEDVN